MIPEKYLKKITNIIEKSDIKGAKFFIFGSSLTANTFNDVDLAVINIKDSNRLLRKLRTDFEESNLPYEVDIIDFENSSEDFKKEVLKTDILWIT